MALLAACKDDRASTIPLTRVRAVTVERVDFAPSLTFTGDIEARIQTDLAFKVSGKISERLVNVGDHVTKGQVLARLDPEQQDADVASAKASVASAQAMLRQSTGAFERQRSLLATGNTTRHNYDQAESTLRTNEGQLRQAQADLATAQDMLSNTELRADADGVITRQAAEAGQVVAQAQVIYTLARDGPRDAVFNVHELALVHLAADKGLRLSLVSNPAVQAVGDVRETSPAVDPSTQTVKVKVGLRQTPPEMSLGVLVNALAPVTARNVIMVPWSSLFDVAGKPAVWTVDPGASTVSLKPIVIDRYTRHSIAVASGLQPGEVVVSAGIQLLRPGQKVEVVPEGKP